MHDATFDQEGDWDDPQKIHRKLQKSVHYFEQLHKTMHEGSPEEQERAAEEYRELQADTEALLEEMAEKMAMSVEELREELSNPENYSKEQWAAIEESRDEAEAILEEVAAPKRKKKRRAKWPPRI